MTHSRTTVLRALALHECDVPASVIARRLEVPRSTVRTWIAGEVPRSLSVEVACSLCGAPTHDIESLPLSYAYLLGMYLGDGCISPHPRQVFKLRVTLDAAYPGIVRETREAMEAVMPASRVAVAHHGPNCREVYAYSKAWPCLFSQHGPGKKHERPIVLKPWQERIVDEHPELLLRGLIHSDGHRFINTGRAGWHAPRYGFVNTSADIREIFCRACDQLGLNWTTARHRAARVVYVSRKADVARLDEFVGPKSWADTRPFATLSAAVRAAIV